MARSAGATASRPAARTGRRRAPARARTGGSMGRRPASQGRRAQDSYRRRRQQLRSPRPYCATARSATEAAAGISTSRRKPHGSPTDSPTTSGSVRTCLRSSAAKWSVSSAKGEDIERLRRDFPVRTEHAGRRVCDGLRILAEPTFPAPIDPAQDGCAAGSTRCYRHVCRPAGCGRRPPSRRGAAGSGGCCDGRRRRTESTARAQSAAHTS